VARSRSITLSRACLLLALVLSTPSSALAADEAAVRDVFSGLEQRWDQLTAYECDYAQRSEWKDRRQEFRGHYLFEKPNRIRVEIRKGDGEGTVLLWDGGPSVRARKGGILSLFPLRLDLRNRWLLDPFEQDLSASTWRFLLDEGRSALREGRLELLGSETWEGTKVWVLRNRYPPGAGTFAEDLVYVDRQNRWPLRVLRKDGADRVVQEILYRGTRIDPPVPEGAFTEF